jgi:hypothetical protein
MIRFFLCSCLVIPSLHKETKWTAAETLLRDTALKASGC